MSLYLAISASLKGTDNVCVLGSTLHTPLMWLNPVKPAA